MKTDQPVHNSGKTRINRFKKPGQSWTKLRDEENKVSPGRNKIGDEKKKKKRNILPQDD